MNFTILRNKRHSPEDFTVDYPCDFCAEFSGKIIELSKTKRGGIARPLRICKSCLTKMIGAIDKDYQDNFEKEYLEERYGCKTDCIGETRPNVCTPNCPDYTKQESGFNIQRYFERIRITESNKDHPNIVLTTDQQFEIIRQFEKLQIVKQFEK